MVAGLDARGTRADGVFLIGCGADIVSIKPALEAVTSLQVSAPEEPDMALARGAALASANAPLFSSSTAALAYALDPATGEMSPGAFGPTNLAYSALDDEDDGSPRRTSFVVAGSALAAISAVVAGVLLVSLTADRPSAVRQYPRAGVANPAQVPSQPPQAQPPQAQLPAPSSPPPPAPPPPAPTAVAAPPPPPAYTAPAATPPAAPVRRAPTPRAPASVPTPARRTARSRRPRPHRLPNPHLLRRPRARR